MSTTIYYSAYDKDDGHRHAMTSPADYDLSDDSWNESIAEQCADDWHDNHDGFEAAWPRVFRLFKDKTGPSFARMQVDRETVLQFNATPV